MPPTPSLGLAGIRSPVADLAVDQTCHGDDPCSMLLAVIAIRLGECLIVA